MTSDIPWVSVESVCHMYGYNFQTAKTKIQNGTFDVPTYKVGRIHVIDRVVHEKFFTLKREAGLHALESTKC